MARFYPWVVGVLILAIAGLVVRLSHLQQQVARLEAQVAATAAAPAAPLALGEASGSPGGEAAGADERTDLADAPGAELNAPPAAESRERGPRRRPVRLEELLQDPEFAAAWHTQQKAMLDGPYAALFQRLRLPPEQTDQLKSLLAERFTARMDVMNAARAQGLSGRENRAELQQLLEQAQAEIDQGIRELLGEAGYAEFQRYEQTGPQRSTVRQLEQRLSYSGAPLTPAQAETLVTILSDTPGSTPSGRSDVVLFGPAATTAPGPPGAVSDAAIARAQAILSPQQVEALRQLQREQAAQQQVSEIMRQRFQQQRIAPPAPPGSG